MVKFIDEYTRLLLLVCVCVTFDFCSLLKIANTNMANCLFLCFNYNFQVLARNGLESEKKIKTVFVTMRKHYFSIFLFLKTVVQRLSRLSTLPLSYAMKLWKEDHNLSTARFVTNVHNMVWMEFTLSLHHLRSWPSRRCAHSLVCMELLKLQWRNRKIART